MRIFWIRIPNTDLQPDFEDMTNGHLISISYRYCGIRLLGMKKNPESNDKRLSSATLVKTQNVLSLQ